MSHELATLVLAAFGGVLVVGSLIFFLRPRWLWQWLKGMMVFAVLALGLYSLAIAVTLLEYESLEGMDTVATVSTYRQGDQLWQVALQLPDEPPRYEMVRGDQWQLDARMMRFAGPIRWLGVAPGVPSGASEWPLHLAGAGTHGPTLGHRVARESMA